jgi:thiol:disulfide interchange protein
MTSGQSGVGLACHRFARSASWRQNSKRALVAKLTPTSIEILVRYGVMGIPTLILFKGGKEAGRVVGLTGYSTLKSKLEKLLD